jgi:hypothetical protein
MTEKEKMLACLDYLAFDPEHCQSHVIPAWSSVNPSRLATTSGWAPISPLTLESILVIMRLLVLAA